jgi:putative transposase-like DNA-binding protein
MHSPAGFLVPSIRADYAPPEGFESRVGRVRRRSSLVPSRSFSTLAARMRGPGLRAGDVAPARLPEDPSAVRAVASDRRSQAEFECRQCGYAANTDFNAALNLRAKASVRMPKGGVVAAQTGFRDCGRDCFQAHGLEPWVSERVTVPRAWGPAFSGARRSAPRCQRSGDPPLRALWRGARSIAGSVRIGFLQTASARR